MARFSFRDTVGRVFARKPKPEIVELGATGTIFFSGMISEEEYNPDLRGDKAIEVYERMRRSDGQVKATLLACELPFHSAHWDIEAASESAKDQEIAAFVRENLFEGMTITWDSFLHHALLMLPFGFSVFEKVWELRDGEYRWRKLAPRLPKTIKKWWMDPEGGLERIEQWTWKGDSKSGGGTYGFIDIPAEKLLVFTNEKEGSNFQGVSLLRAAYKHWYYKDQLYRIDGIAAERHGVGLAVFKYPSTASEEDKTKVKEVGERLHVHERAYLALPDSVDFDLKGVAGQLHDIKGSIEHHDMQIVRSILAQFINLGASDVGSYALSQDQSGFFLMALRAVGRNICDTFNRYAMRQLVDYNWDVDAYPRLAVSGLEYYDVAKYSKAIGDLVNAGLILPDREIEAELRRILHLPAIRVKQEEKAALRLTEWEPRRHLRGAEQHVAFKEIKDELDSAEDKLVEAAKEIQDRQIQAVIGMALKDIEKGDAEAIVRIDVPYRDQMANAIGRVLIELFEYGRDRVREELAKQRGKVRGVEPVPMGDEESIVAFIRTRAKATANTLGSKLRAAMAWEALRQIRGGRLDKTRLVATLTTMSDKELRSTAKFTVAEAFDLGRERQAKDMADDIDRVVYSAILDENTCGTCSDLDGREFKFPSTEWDEVAPPYKDCEGRDRCRCIGVYVYKIERSAVR